MSGPHRHLISSVKHVIVVKTINYSKSIASNNYVRSLPPNDEWQKSSNAVGSGRKGRSIRLPMLRCPTIQFRSSVRQKCLVFMTIHINKRVDKGEVNNYFNSNCK